MLKQKNAVPRRAATELWMKQRKATPMTRAKRLATLLLLAAIVSPAARAGGLESIANHIVDTVAGDTAIQDMAREFVFTNSVHGEGAPYAWTIPVVLDMLWDAYANGGPQPIIACGPRSLALMAIYDRLGYTSNQVSIFTDAGTDLASHGVIEVFNQVEGRWEIQDPDFGVYYVLTSTGERLSTEQMLVTDLDEVTPMSPRGNGWVENNVDHLRMMYFELAIYYPRLTEAPQQIFIYVNTNRFNIDQPFPDTNQSFREYAAVRYRGARLLLIPGAPDSGP
jgi:hypothetical protein